ncbi:MAG TPA: hypothetical protein VJU87_04430, partial [Gemmatimonadaceae bacterium]|nr:hypothetical protein [Gemmatimonadaceae bacterium]
MIASLDDREARRGGAGPGVPVVALWGAPGSGKSGIAGALHVESGRSAGARWTVLSVGLDADACAYVDSASLALRRRGVRETTIRRPAAPVLLPLSRRDGARTLDRLQLLVVDPSGSNRSPDEPRSAHERALCADAMLWLIDMPAAGSLTSASRMALLREVVGFLTAAKAAQLPIPVALCLTKLDRLPASEMHRALAHPAEALRAVLGDAALGWLEAACPRLGYFALTAAGTVRNAVRPVGLVPALDWF